MVVAGRSISVGDLVSEGLLSEDGLANLSCLFRLECFSVSSRVTFSSLSVELVLSPSRL